MGSIYFDLSNLDGFSGAIPRKQSYFSAAFYQRIKIDFPAALLPMFGFFTIYYSGTPPTANNAFSTEHRAEFLFFLL
jgi:hypothetical protein